MKVAYLITAFNNYLHLEKLIDALDDGTRPVFFVHIDKKADMPLNFSGRENIVFIKRINVWWGGWSHLQAILSLMKSAAQKELFDYYVLISGTDYPIRPNSFLYEKLKEGGEYINIVRGFQRHKPASRIRYYYFDCFDRRNRNNLKTRFFLGLEKVLRRIISKKKYPFEQIYHGSTWWALSHPAVTHILHTVKKCPDLVGFFRTSWCPEEALIPTIIGNSEFITECKTNLSFTDWTTNPAPAIINREHLKLFKEHFEFENVYGKYTPFFARKFNDNSITIINEIDNTLR